MTIVRFQTCYTSSTEGTIRMWKYLEEPAASYSIPTWTNHL